ncbi:hypothetical protein [Halopseudomonas salegens]|uniref:Uncharacterized protein n=1 Tax=Halopseudomonas salegens TaxID=1434072 RepID=A0A1H2HPQ3_9GAMM|nr:hypothetical protein [Halopseudomonas salegens]SDU33834.1 hypothetical protein SAMN05216210_3212 [Halopseudomonas salegens]
MKEIFDLRFFACAFVVVVFFFMVGLLSYGDLVSFVVKNGFIDSPDKYWHFTLINGFVFALVGFVMVLYIWLDTLQKPSASSFVLLLFKMIILSSLVYAAGLFFIWEFYSSLPSENMFFDSNILVSIDEFNIYWSAVFLLSFWVFLLMLTVLRRIYQKKN